MTYRLWYIITWPSAILASILRIGCLFTDLGKAWLQILMHVKLGICIVFIPRKMPTNFQTIAKQRNKHTTNFMRLWNEGATIILLP
jgi:putative membrane protein